jgi:acyl-coenzyme A synthetase/AMP-(fatty) acid ligase
MLPRIIDWYDVMLGAIKLGAIPMPGTTLLTERDIEYRTTRAEASVIITDADGAGRTDAVGDRCVSLRIRIVVGSKLAGWLSLDDAMTRASDAAPDPTPTRADDPLLIYFTSGTEAYPKMVLHTQASYGIGHEITARYWQDLGRSDLHCTLSDTGWAKAAWGMLFGQWRMGAALFLWDARGKPDYELLMRLITRHGVTSFCAPPTVYRSLVCMDLAPYDWSSLRHCTAAGEPLNPEVIKIWREETGRTVYDGYGQTETVNVCANYRGMPVKPGSMGKPTPGFDVHVVDGDGTKLPPGEEGHLAIRVRPDRPVGLFKEYWLDPGATAKAIRGDWYFTGDRAVTDDEGYFWFVGRGDDIIISAAYRIGPFEVESALIEHPAVAEAAVVGKPHAERGQIVKAFVVLAPGFTASAELALELQDHTKRVTAPYKYPREIEFVATLPKTVSGKIRRVELRQRERASEDTPVPTRP